LNPGGRCPERLDQAWMRWRKTTTPDHDLHDCKRGKEVNAMRQTPHPYEFALYYDI